MHKRQSQSVQCIRSAIVYVINDVTIPFKSMTAHSQHKYLHCECTWMGPKSFWTSWLIFFQISNTYLRDTCIIVCRQLCISNMSPSTCMKCLTVFEKKRLILLQEFDIRWLWIIIFQATQKWFGPNFQIGRWRHDKNGKRKNHHDWNVSCKGQKAHYG